MEESDSPTEKSKPENEAGERSNGGASQPGEGQNRPPYRRRFPHRGAQNSPGLNRSKPPAADPLAPNGNGSPRGQNRPEGQGRPDQQNSRQPARPGKNPRQLPDRDRGPRRTQVEGQVPARKTEPGGQADGQSGAGGAPTPEKNSQGRPVQQQRGRSRRTNGQPRPDRRQAGPSASGQRKPDGRTGARSDGHQPEQPGRKPTRGNSNGGKRGYVVREKTTGAQNRPGQAGRKPRAATPRKPRSPRRDGENPFEYIKPPPIKTTLGIKARSQEGQYTLSWWAARWIMAMENLVDGRRLSRGRSYARDGQVLSIEEKPGGVTALVQGSRLKPYKVSIEVIALADFEWEKVFDVLASQALFAAQLLAGEMPRNIEEAFQAAGTSLFPARLGDLNTDCTCPDWANPCKHVAATHYILAERFDEDPFLLFRLRGRTSEQILAALRERRAGAGEEPLIEEPPLEEISPVVSLETLPERFYRLAQPLDEFALSFKEPAIEMSLLKRLGDPNFLGQESLLATLEPVYRAVRKAALEAALGESGGEEEETTNGKPV
jgi:uncharacterized Zn finger protein